jgi:hypothetical protein
MYKRVFRSRRMYPLFFFFLNIPGLSKKHEYTLTCRCRFLELYTSNLCLLTEPLQINEKNQGILEKRYISYIRYRYQTVSI